MGMCPRKVVRSADELRKIVPKQDGRCQNVRDTLTTSEEKQTQLPFAAPVAGAALSGVGRFPTG